MHRSKSALQLLAEFMAISPLLLVTTLFAQATLQPRTMPKIAQVDARYVSFNIEAVEVAGGRFWKPFEDESAPTQPDARGPAAEEPAAAADPYEYRPPINLENPKLRKLAAALAPSYLRVSGTWMNSTFFQDDDAPAMTSPPKGYKGVITRAEWKGVIDFSKAVGSDLVTSAAISDGTRDAEGLWTPQQAKALFDYTKSIGGHIAAAEFMNEPTFAVIGAAPKGYDARSFARDAKIFQSFLQAESPDTIFLGPGSIGEGVPMVQGMPMPKMINTDDMLKDTGPIFDAFSYHFYTTLSTRCVGNRGLSWEKVLTPAYLDRNVDAEEYYAKLRDLYVPGKPIWNTETGEAGCGGDKWASDFVDTFRFIDQLGILAQRNVQTVIVNTLAASDYGMIDGATLTPRPDYWAALLWKRLIGSRVLKPGVPLTSGAHIYAHCAKDLPGAVTLVVINLDQNSPLALRIPMSGDRYTLSATKLLSKTVSLNDVELSVGPDGSVPHLVGSTIKAGIDLFAPRTISFIVLPRANNESCK